MIAKFVWQISDLNISRNNYVNFRNSFEKLIEMISANSQVECQILIICGNIFEHKSFMMLDDIQVFQNMCKELEDKKIKTIITLGDNNQNKLDNLNENSIAQLIKRYNYITCMQPGQHYSEFDNVIFQVIQPEIPSIPIKNKVNIGIYHYQQDSWETFLQQYSNNTEFQFILIGNRQYQEFSEFTPITMCCGSFIQLDKNDGIQKGGILWNIEEQSPNRFSIPLKELNIRIAAENDNSSDLPDLLSEQTVKFVSLLYKQCSDEFIQELKDRIVSKYGIINKVVQCDIPEVSLENLSGLELFKNMVAHQDNSEKFIEFHSEQLKNLYSVRCKSYKINYLHWNNILCYGEDNYIDFRNFKQNLVILNGNNKEGKSSIIDIITRALFNESRGYKDDIINKHKDKGDITISFSVESDTYVLEQVFTRKGNHHKLLKNDQDITPASIIKTYKFIKEGIGIGQYDNFVNTTVAFQNRQFLTDLSSKDFALLMLKITNIEIFKTIEDNIKKEVGKLNSVIKEISKYIIPDQIDHYSNIDSNMEQIKFSVDSQIEIQQQIDNINTLIYKLNRDIIPIKQNQKDVLSEINNFTPQQNIIEELLKLDKNWDSRVQIILEKLEQQNVILEQKLQNIDIEKILSKDFTAVQHNIDSIISEIKQLREQCYKPEESFIDVSYQQVQPLKQCEITELFQISEDRSKQEIVAEIKNCQKDLLTYRSQLTVQAELIHSEQADHVIDKPEYYDLKDKYQKFVEKGLPNYDEISQKIMFLKLQQDVYSQLQFADECSNCNNNQHLVQKLNVNTNKQEPIELLQQQLANRIKDEKMHQFAVKRLEKIKQYDEYLKICNIRAVQDKYKQRLQELKDNENILHKIQQNEIFLENQEIFKANQVALDNLVRVKNSEKEKENLIKWNKLQDLEKQFSLCKEKQAYQDYQKQVVVQNYINYLKQYNQYLQNLNNLKIIKQNEEHQLQIEQLQKSKAALKQKLINLNKLEFNQSYAEQLAKQNEQKSYIRIREENQSRVQFLTQYLNYIDSKTGIQSIILSKAYQFVQAKCNQTLSEISDFQIEIQHDKDIKIMIIEDDVKVPVSLASGFQKFILDMLIRVSLAEMPNTPHTNLMFVDEGFGSLDRENFIQIANFLHKLKKKFDSFIIISHMEELKSYGDIVLNISKQGYFSNLKFGSLTPRQLQNSLRNTKQPAITDSADNPGEDITVMLKKAPVVLKEINQQDSDKLFKIYEDKIICLACSKEFQNKKGIVDRHIKSKTYVVKHQKYLSSL